MGCIGRFGPRRAESETDPSQSADQRSSYPRSGFVSKNAVRTIFAVAAATALMMSLISPAGAGHGEHENGKPVKTTATTATATATATPATTATAATTMAAAAAATTIYENVSGRTHKRQRARQLGTCAADGGNYIEYCAKAGSGVNLNCGPVRAPAREHRRDVMTFKPCVQASRSLTSRGGKWRKPTHPPQPLLAQSKSPPQPPLSLWRKKSWTQSKLRRRLFLLRAHRCSLADPS